MAIRPSRRQFLALAGALAGGAALPVPAVAAAPDPWALADRIVRETRRPRFPARYFDVTDYGAVGDGAADCTAAFRSAIQDCAARGGGHVVVPAGRFLTGPLHLKSRVDLHLESGATIAFDTDPAAYLPAVYTRDGGIECMNYSPFVYAHGEHDIAVTGDGTLDGQADDGHWWPWAGKTEFGWQPGDPTGDADAAALEQMATDGVPVAQRVFGAGHYLRPQFLQPYGCDRVLISGVTTTNTPNWQLNPVLCTNVTIENTTADSLGPNNDGCDPECCDHVVIDGVTFNTGDDCIAVKAGKDADGRRIDVPCQNIVIRGCDFRAGHGAVTIGSEMTGGVRNLFASDCRSESLSLNDFLRLKTNSERGGFIEEVHLRDVGADQLNDAGVSIDFYYGDGPGHGYNPSVTGIHVERLHVGTTRYPVYLAGYPDDPIGAVSLADCVFNTASATSIATDVAGLTFDDVYVNGAPATPPTDAS
jgi:polygalacturonase